MSLQSSWTAALFRSSSGRRTLVAACPTLQVQRLLIQSALCWAVSSPTRPRRSPASACQAGSRPGPPQPMRPPELLRPQRLRATPGVCSYWNGHVPRPGDKLNIGRSPVEAKTMKQCCPDPNLTSPDCNSRTSSCSSCSSSCEARERPWPMEHKHLRELPVHHVDISGAGHPSPRHLKSAWSKRLRPLPPSCTPSFCMREATLGGRFTKLLRARRSLMFLGLLD